MHFLQFSDGDELVHFHLHSVMELHKHRVNVIKVPVYVHNLDSST